MTGTELRACSDGEGDVALASGRFGDELSLIDHRNDAAGAEFEQVVIDFGEDCFRHAVFQMNAAV